MNGPKDTKHSEIGRHEVWCDTENMISERCNCMASSYIDQIQDYDQIVAELRAEVERQKKKIEAFVDAEMVRAEYQGFTYGQALDEIAKQKTNIATQARVIEIAKRVLNNAGLRPPDGGTPTVETICEDLNDAIIEIAAIEKEGSKDE